MTVRLLQRRFRLVPAFLALGALLCLWAWPAYSEEYGEDIPDEVTNLLGQAQTAWGDGVPHRSLKIYERLLKKYPNGPVASLTLEKLAGFHLDMEQPEKSAALYRKLLKEFPEHPKRLEFLKALGESQPEDTSHIPNEIVLEASKQQATQGKVADAYKTLGEVDFSSLSTVTPDLAFRLCGLSAYLARRQKRFPAAIVALAAQMKWADKPGYQWMLVQEMQGLLSQITDQRHINWIEKPELRDKILPQMGPESTLPRVDDPVLLAIFDARRQEIIKGVKRPKADDALSHLIKPAPMPKRAPAQAKRRHNKRAK